MSVTGRSEDRQVSLFNSFRSNFVFVTALLDKIFEATLTKIAEVAVLRSQFPRTVISVVVQEMDDSGGVSPR